MSLIEQHLQECRLCPRNCGVNRLIGETGFCDCGADAVVASAFPHHGEEQVLSGYRGSGTIFFSACNLRCLFCQNDDISHQLRGRAVDPAELARTMIRLENQGCHNINLVSPEPYIPHIIEAVKRARKKGMRLPVVYNSSAYIALESLILLEGSIDIYMPDFKFMDQAASKRYLLAEDYPGIARAALKEMQRQAGDLMMDDHNIARQGLLVRHLVMPGFVEDSKCILHFLYDEISPNVYVNIMGQYHPSALVTACDYPELYAEISRIEIEKVRRYAVDIGISRID